VRTRIYLRRQRRQRERAAARLEKVIRRLKDACYDLEHWSFADRPSRHEDRLAEIHGLIRRVEELGGDALDLLPYRYDYLASDAMPETFERVRTSYTSSPYWRTVRKSDLVAAEGETAS
jgi:hypothetical protein